ncbi:hypothetical protein FRC12_011962 [Ceratobasidium sp. 428]|nr:hypothetical protein FRC12_011962 [Ceratobasidium sp. 428]
MAHQTVVYSTFRRGIPAKELSKRPVPWFHRVNGVTSLLSLPRSMVACGGSTATTSRDWKLHRLSDDIGEADSRAEELALTTLVDAEVQTEDEKKLTNAIDRALMEKDKLIADKDRQLGDTTSRLITQGKDLAQARLELAEGANRLIIQHQELAQIRLELVEVRSRLVETQDALRQSEERLASRDAQLSRIKEQLNGSDTEGSLTRQKEMDEMRTRMQAIEQFMSSQVSKVVRSGFLSLLVTI